MANNNVPVVDLPFFELCTQAPTASSALGALTTSEEGDNRFIFYISGNIFFKYDTVADTYIRLADPPTTPVTLAAMRYTARRGYHGRVLSATSTTVTIPGLRGPTLNGKTIRIEHGPGAGQERVLTYVRESIHDYGVATSITSGNVGIQDTTKRWRVNQWAGYMIAIVFGSGVLYNKKIIYNDTNTLYFADANLVPHDPWNNQALFGVSPYGAISATAGSQTHYQIMSSTFNVTAWDTIPTDASYFTTLTGGVYLVSSLAASPFFSFQYYDVINDAWQAKTTPNNMFGSALTADIALERTGRIGGYLVNGTASSGTSRTLVDSSKTLENNRYANHRIFITGGTGKGQNRRIVAHNATTFTIPRNWDINPDNTSTYEIWPDSDRVYLATTFPIFAYSPENDYWMNGQAFDDGIVTNIGAVFSDWLPIGVNTGARIAAGVQAVASAPTAGGTLYTIGDVLTCSVGGTGAQVRVTSIAPGGVVTGVELVHSGTATGFTTGTGKATTGGTGTGCTINITTVGPTALITTSSNHFLQTGDVVTFYGCTEAAWNAAHTIIGVPAVNTFCVIPTATANMNNTAAQTTTTIYDPTKNWITNEHVGRIVSLLTNGVSPTSQLRWITANTSNTLTVATITAGAAGSSKYVIYDSKMFGIDRQRKEDQMEPYGWASSGSTTTLVDSAKNWIPNQWAGYLFKIEAGTGYGSGRISIISNTETTLTFATQSFTPDATTYYEIADSWGLATAATTTVITESTTKNWAVNQWAGKVVRFISGSGAAQNATISSNTSTALTVPTLGTSPDTTTAYAIFGITRTSVGNMQMLWNFGSTDANKKSRYLYTFRGNTPALDIYDITTGRFDISRFYYPQSTSWGSGASYAYDGENTIYIAAVGTGGFIRVNQYNIETNEVSGLATSTTLQGTTTTGNFMEVINTASGLQYIYILQSTGTLMIRALVS